MSWQNSPYLIPIISFGSGALVALLAAIVTHKLTIARDGHSRKRELASLIQAIIAELEIAKKQFQGQEAASFPVMTTGYDILMNRGLSVSIPLDLFFDLHVAYWHLKSLNYLIDRIHIGKHDLIHLVPQVSDPDAIEKIIENSNRRIIEAQQNVLKFLDKVIPQIKPFYTHLLYDIAPLSGKARYRLYNYFKPSGKIEKPR